MILTFDNSKLISPRRWLFEIHEFIFPGTNPLNQTDMKLPSLSHLQEESAQTFLRFPFALMSAVVGSAAWILIIYNDSAEASSRLQDVGLVGLLGISLFTAITLVCERVNAGTRTTLLAGVGAAVALVLYGLMLPAEMWGAPTYHWIRYWLFAAGLHFLVAVGPFFRRGEHNGFWQFNKSLFLRMLTSGIYSAVLYAGLAVAILAVDQLFEAHIDSKIYFELWVFIACVFNTWFFLAGIPDDLGALESETDYPKPLKVFTQYILLPLVFIYFVILYAYTVKIIATWDWPKGWVGYLVLGFSILGIFSLLLVHPIKERIENAWIRIVSRYYYVALIPLAFLLLLAIWRRISEYGLTEKRYFVVVLGLWLLGMIANFLLSKSKSIKVIPATLCVIAFLTSFGPWGAMRMSEQNQKGRLEEVLTRTGILLEGKVHKAAQRLAFEDCRRISAIVQYLNDVHGLSAIQPWFDVPLDTLGKGTDAIVRYNQRYNNPRRVAELMGVTFVEPWQTAAAKNLSFQSVQRGMIDVRGYDVLFENFALTSYDTVKTLTTGSPQWNLKYSPTPLTVELSNRQLTGDSVVFDLRPMIAGLDQDYGAVAYASNIPAGRMTLDRSLGAFKASLYFNSVTVNKSGERYEGTFMQASLMIGGTARR